MKRTSTRLAEQALQEWEIRQGRGRTVSQDMPLNGWTLALAFALIAAFALALSVWPIGPTP